MTMDDFIVFGRPAIGEEEIAEVVEVLRSGWLGTGPRVMALRRSFAEFKRIPSEQVCALNSCTTALHLSLLAAGIGPGDEVITTPLTFCATVNAILHVGAVPVLADIDETSLNIDPAAIALKITEKTRAIIPVHFAGRPCEMDAICELARRHKLLVIEDCAHALEASYRGRPTGTLGDFGAFSLYATKNVTAGEGGLLIAAQADSAARIARLSMHGLSQDAWQRYGKQGFRHYDVVECGFKSNMMDLQAAIALHQLHRVWQAQARRLAIWKIYQEAFASLPMILPSLTPGYMVHAHHLYTVRISAEACGLSRDQVAEKLTDRGIGVGVHYLPLTAHSYYRAALGWADEQMPIAHKVGQQILSLPLYPAMDDIMVERVVLAVTKILN